MQTMESSGLSCQRGVLTVELFRRRSSISRHPAGPLSSNRVVIAGDGRDLCSTPGKIIFRAVDGDSPATAGDVLEDDGLVSAVTSLDSLVAFSS